MNKERIERAFRKAGVVPVDRCIIRGREVFIADGLSEPPHEIWVRRHALEPQEFPYGCYVTLWCIARGEDALDTGGLLFCDRNHDMQEIAMSVRQKARINAAYVAAENFIRSREKEPALNA